MKKYLNGLNLAESVYRSMVRIRIAETLAADYYIENRVFSFVHFCIGQEFAPAAVGEILSPTDRAFGNHRSHGHFLGKGGSAFRMFSEMLGKVSGPSSGKGGSMHLIDPKVGFAGTSPILSSSLPIAAGSAWEQKVSASPGVTTVFTGDGASEEGNFYETLNLASLWQLPLIVIVENNLYSVNSPLTARRPANFSMENLVKGLGVDFFLADGSNILNDLKVLQASYDLAKLHSKPSVVEVRAFRHLAHSSPLSDDNLGYRVEDSKDERSRRDPISLLGEQLRAMGHSGASLELIWTQARQELHEDLLMAASQSDPESEDLETGVYA
jgi:pyruvate dehydrogenase E1 component alpha subunit